MIAYYNTHDKRLRHDCLDIIIDESLRIIASERVLVRLAIAKHPKVAALSKNVPEGCTLDRIHFMGSYGNPAPGKVGSSAMLPAVKDKLPPENLLT